MAAGTVEVMATMATETVVATEMGTAMETIRAEEMATGTVGVTATVEVMATMATETVVATEMGTAMETIRAEGMATGTETAEGMRTAEASSMATDEPAIATLVPSRSSGRHLGGRNHA